MIVRGRARGFTLIEILVVIVIVSILVTFAALSIRNDRSAAVEEEARRFASLVDLAAEEAVLSGRELGIGFHRQGYRFLVLDLPESAPAEWVPIRDDRLLRPRELPPDISFQLLLDGVPVSLPIESPRAGPPQVFLLSSGERTPFRLRLSSGEALREIEGHGLAVTGLGAGGG